MNVGPHHAILMRHAHADWPAYKGLDFDRPLTPQGLADASAAAAAIRDAAYRPDLLLTSPAMRTLQTAEIVARTLALPASTIRTVEVMYNASADCLHAELLHAFTIAGAVMVVAHNPGISELARRLTGARVSLALLPAQWTYITTASGQELPRVPENPA